MGKKMFAVKVENTHYGPFDDLLQMHQWLRQNDVKFDEIGEITKLVKPRIQKLELPVPIIDAEISTEKQFVVPDASSNRPRLIYFRMEGCKFCDDFDKVWDQIKTDPNIIASYEPICVSFPRRSNWSKDPMWKFVNYSPLLWLEFKHKIGEDHGLVYRGRIKEYQNIAKWIEANQEL